ncbi:hypothetical protein AOLI_G00007700 [Acnodon oligacanthus]
MVESSNKMPKDGRQKVEREFVFKAKAVTGVKDEMVKGMRRNAVLNSFSESAACRSVLGRSYHARAICPPHRQRKKEERTVTMKGHTYQSATLSHHTAEHKE